MIKISIIICGYNVAEYINRCLDSIRNQTMEDFEIIFVDDGSNDNTVRLIDEYMQKYDIKIKVLKNNMNLGAGASRNIGVKAASGKYLMFIDADDWVDCTICEKMYNKAEEDFADIVYCGAHRDDGRGNVIKIVNFMPEYFCRFNIGELTEEGKKATIMSQWIIAYWGRLYLRKFWLDSGFSAMNGMRYNEDTITILLSLLAKRASYVNEDLYTWYVRTGSVTESIMDKTVYRKKAAKKMLSESKRLDLYDKYKSEIDMHYIRNYYLNSIRMIISHKESDEFAMDSLKMLSEDLKTEEIDINNNYYFNVFVKSNEIKLLNILKSDGVERFIEEYYEEYRRYYSYAKENIIKLFEKYEGQQIYVWGAGKKLRSMLKICNGLSNKLTAIVDSDIKKHGRKIEGLKIIDYTDICEGVCIVINERHFNDIKEIIGDRLFLIDLDSYIKYGVI